MATIPPFNQKLQNDYDYQLFIRLKNQIGFQKSKQYMDWFHSEYPEKDPHHPFGSIGSLKTTDLACIPLSRIEHESIEDEYSFAIWNLPLVFRTIFEYIKFLEEQCQKEK